MLDRVEKLVLLAVAGALVICVLGIILIVMAVGGAPSAAQLTVTSVFASSTAGSATAYVTATQQALLFQTASPTPTFTVNPTVLAQTETAMALRLTASPTPPPLPTSPSPPPLPPTAQTATAQAQAVCATPTGSPPALTEVVPTPTFAPGGDSIALDQPVEVTLDPNPAGRYSTHYHAFALEEPALVTVNVQTGDVLCGALFVQLLTESGAMLSQQRFQGIGVISLRDVPLEAPGTYLVYVRGTETHPIHYTLTVRRGVPLLVEAGEIAYGQTVAGDLVIDLQQATWHFTGRAGQVVTIRAEGLGLPKALTLLGPDGRTLIAADRGSRREGLIDSYALRADGQYTILVGNIGDNIGPYRLSLFLEEPED